MADRTTKSRRRHKTGLSALKYSIGKIDNSFEFDNDCLIFELVRCCRKCVIGCSVLEFVMLSTAEHCRLEIE